MRDNRGISYVFVTFLMFAVFTILLTLWNMGMNDIKLTREVNDRSKAYYLAEAGVYYAGSLILNNVTNALPLPPNPAGPLDPPAVEVDKPFAPGGTIDSTDPDNYYNLHKFQVYSMTQTAPNEYTVVAIGQYKGRQSKIQAKVTIDTGAQTVAYSEMTKLTDKNLQ